MVAFSTTAGGVMKTGTNKGIVRMAAVEHFNNPDILRDFCIPDFIVHFSWDLQIRGVEEVTRDEISILRFEGIK